MTEADHRNGAPVAITPDSRVLPKRNGPRGMLPSTWTGRGVRVEYVGAAGERQETTAILLDWCAMGPIFNLAGAKTVVGWDRLVLCELMDD